jgi:hypothetical protein
MDSKKVVIASLAGIVAAPYLVAALTHPTDALPESPKVALQAITSTSSTVVLDPMLGREISVAPAVDKHPATHITQSK